ncbi:MAG: 2-oxo acid dehydrogenase subunit E2 [Chitinophagales bacterium]|nr:2-oxo acid dehydrogenase subunit E2 [Chitinophagales bacterium]
MPEYQLTMPKLGEGITEATILNWLKKEGESISAHEVILEIATDKVDTEVPTPVDGTIKKLLFQVDETVAVDTVIAIIETETLVENQIPLEVKPEVEKSTKEVENITSQSNESIDENERKGIEAKEVSKSNIEKSNVPAVDIPYIPAAQKTDESITGFSDSEKNFSPLVKKIAQVEGITLKELESINGSGLVGKITKDDVLKYIKEKSQGAPISNTQISETGIIHQPQKKISNDENGQDVIIEMDRMRKMIAKNMIESKRISPHVTSFVEVDMTTIVQWRNKYKDSFKNRNGFSLTYMPIFVEAIVKAIIDFPLINISVDGDKIIKKKNINIGIATALPSGNLIIPVIKNANRLSLTGIASELNNLVQKARNSLLLPTDIQGATYTISNIGSFDNILGTPIIPQPQVAIMAVGAIKKRPVVIETPQGDVIGIRQMMYLSHTYDHRVVDGALGGIFAKRVAEYLENFNSKQEI